MNLLESVKSQWYVYKDERDSLVLYSFPHANLCCISSRTTQPENFLTGSLPLEITILNKTMITIDLFNNKIVNSPESQEDIFANMGVIGKYTS